MTALLTALVSILVFGAVILVHELGHFMAARHCGIHVEEFSVGFGPRLFSRRVGDTWYSLRLFPLGGYNLFEPLPDEDGEGTDENAGEKEPKMPAPVRKTGLFPVTVRGLSFEEATPWQRFFVTAAGALMNFVLGAVVLVVLVAIGSQIGGTTVARFEDGATSSDALQIGDTILTINGKAYHTATALSDAFGDETQTYAMTVLRNGKVVSLPAVTVTMTPNENGVAMIDFRVAVISKTPRAVLRQAWEYFRYYAGAILGGFYEMLTGQIGVEELSGPVGTVTAVSQAVQYGFTSVLSLTALLTINVGVFNLLPVPALDGCKLLFLLFEAITHRAVPQRVQAAVNTAGLVALLWLMMLVTVQDVTKFF